MKVALYNLGCRVNQYEAEALAEKFRQADYEIVDFNKKADIYLVNSCAVTTSAASKSRKVARRAKRRGGPDSRVIMIGCYSQISPEEVAAIEEVDYYVTTDDKDDVVKLLEREIFAAEKQTSFSVDVSKKKKELGNRANYSQINNFPDFSLQQVKQRTRANLKIQDGCDQFCSYCIIPLARGKPRSKPPARIKEEFANLLRSDIKEFILTGIHLGAYGKDLNSNENLASLVSQLLEYRGDFRLRLSSLEIGEVDSQLLQLMASSPKLCNHLHLPLQSGSNKILQAMNRPYNREEYKATIEDIKEKLPQIALTTDVMVGFPGESEKDFQQTCKLVEKVGFSRLHVFPFSPRSGTKAAKMEEKVHSKEKNRRVEILQKIGQQLSYEYYQNFVDTPLIALLEKQKRDNEYAGYTSNYIRVKVNKTDVAESGDAELANSFVEVKFKELRKSGELPATITSTAVSLT